MSKGRVRIGRELAVAGLLYTGLTIAITWPVVAHLTDAVAGFDGRDSLQCVWFNWWTIKSLLVLKSSPAFISWLYYPLGAFHPFLLASLFIPLLMFPVTLVGGVKLAYNLAFLLSFVLGGMLTYLLMRRLVGNRLAAFVAGVIVVFAPNRMGHTLAGHLLLFSTWLLPLYALAVVSLFRRPSWRWTVVGAIALSGLTLTQPLHLAYFALPFTLIYGVVMLLGHRIDTGRLKRIAWFGLAMLGLSCCLLLPFFFPLLGSALEGGQDFFSNVGIEEHSTDLLAFVVPSPFHPMWSDGETAMPVLPDVIDVHRHLEERLAYLGLVPLGLSVWALLRRRRGVYVWLALGLAACVLAMGPSLKIAGRQTGILLPYYWLMDLPFLRWSRTPGRLNEITSLALAALAAFGLADILTHLRTACWRWVVSALVVLLICFEYLVLFPYPLAAQISPSFYTTLREEKPGAPLLDLPVTGSRRASNYSLLFQTLHDRPIAGGYFERDPPGTVEWSQFFDRLVSPLSSQAIPQAPDPALRRQILADNGIQIVVARHWLMTDQAARDTLAFLPSVLGQPYYVDDSLSGWQVTSADVSVPPYTLLVAEKGWETVNDGALVRLEEESLLFVYANRAGPATLVLETIAASEPGLVLWVDESGPIEIGQQPGRDDVRIQLAEGLNWFDLRLTSCDECRVEFSRIVVE